MIGWLNSWRESRIAVVVIVAVALLLDSMLLTVVVPIVPVFLYEIDHPVDYFAYKSTNITTAFPPIIVQSSFENNNATITYSGIKKKPSLDDQRHEDLSHEAVSIGIMFASKALVQLITSPFVAILTNKIGYSIPMFMGFAIMFIATIIFAFGRTYFVLFVARAMQGIGSCCSSVAGMGMLAERYPDDKERAFAMSYALGGLALGILIGPPFGGIMYQYVNKSAPFIIIAMLALIGGLFQLILLRPRIVKPEKKPKVQKGLITDPYILIAAGATTFTISGISVIEPSLPIWMMSTMGANQLHQGVAFVPSSIAYLIGTVLFGPLGHWIGRWLMTLLDMVLMGLSLLCIPLASNVYQLIVPMAGIGLAIEMVDSAMLPHMAYLVDIRHSGVYGSVYAIADVAVCLGFVIGPALSGVLVNFIGFEWMLFLIAFINFLYAPLMFFVRNPATEDEKETISTTQTTHL